MTTRLALRAGLAALAFAYASAVCETRAQDYPARDIHVICPFLPGSSSDILVRFLGEKLSALSGRTVVVDDKPGAFGNIGTEYVAKARPDGYTVLIVPGSSTMATAVHTFKKLPFDPVKDFAPVATVAKLAFVIAVDGKSPIMSMADLTAHLKRKGLAASFGVAANTGLIVAELYRKIAGIDAKRIQYRGMQNAMPDLYAGSLDFVSGDVVWAVEQAKAGKIRALAVSSGSRMSMLPDVPTMEEAGVTGFGAVEPWWAVFAPAGVPQPVLAKLEDWFTRIITADDTRAFLTTLGAEPFSGNSKMLGELLARDIARWGELVKLAGIEPQ